MNPYFFNSCSFIAPSEGKINLISHRLYPTGSILIQWSHNKIYPENLAISRITSYGLVHLIIAAVSTSDIYTSKISTKQSFRTILIVKLRDYIFIFIDSAK